MSLNVISISEANRPFPEIVSKTAGAFRVLNSDEYDFLPSNGMTDLKRRRLWSPWSIEGQPVSRHELAHVAWSPPFPKRKLAYNHNVLLAVEDARVNMGLDHIGLQVEFGEAMLKQAVEAQEENFEGFQFGIVALRYAASLGTNGEETLRDAISRMGTEEADTIEQIVDGLRGTLAAARERANKAVASVRDTRAAAKKLAERLEELGWLDDIDSEGATICCCSSAEIIEEVDDEWGFEMDMPSKRRGRVMRSRAAFGVEPGEMFTRSAKMTCSATKPAIHGSTSARPRTEGSVVRYFDRFESSGAIFRAPMRKRGGTILVDTSGSMSLTSDEVEGMLADAPMHTLVAIYSGSGGKGELRIVARDGKFAPEEELEPYGSGNIVDIPALEWLAKQPAPRIWVSDGGVTGCGDKSTDELRRNARKICVNNRIKRVGSPAEAADAIATSR